MYKNFLIIFIFIYSTLLANNDYDMDGVKDSLDKCPNTPITDLVDINGCSIKSLVSLHHFDIITGISYSQTSYDNLEDTDTITESIQVDYYYKKFSIQLNTAYYTSSDDSGMTDSFIGVNYKFSPINKLNIRIGTGIIIPTYKSNLDNNNIDYTASVSISYTVKKINIFTGYNYTMVNDDDTVNVKYQDTNSYSIGVGFYPISSLYISTSFNSSNSIYIDTDDINTLSIYFFYNINKNWFTNINYAYGLSNSASDNYASLKIGYYF